MLNLLEAPDRALLFRTILADYRIWMFNRSFKWFSRILLTVLVAVPMRNRNKKLRRQTCKKKKSTATTERPTT